MFETPFLPLIQNKVTQETFDYLSYFVFSTGIGINISLTSFAHFGLFINLQFAFGNPFNPHVKVMNQPTSEAWFDFWKRYLEEKGVNFHFNSKLQQIIHSNQQVQKCIIKKEPWQSQERLRDTVLSYSLPKKKGFSRFALDAVARKGNVVPFEREIPLLPIIGTYIIPCLYSTPKLFNILLEKESNSGVKRYLKIHQDKMEEEIKQQLSIIINRTGQAKPRGRYHKMSLSHLVEELDDINYLDGMPLVVFQEIYQIRFNDSEPSNLTTLRKILLDNNYTLKLNKMIIKK
jgi:hypothetical protein